MNRKPRVVQQQLPTENITRPAHGDWTARERAARRALRANARRINR